MKKKRAKEPKRKPGRPRGSANADGDGVVRLETIAFRVSDMEREELETKAARAEVGLGIYVREALRSAGFLRPVPNRPGAKQS